MKPEFWEILGNTATAQSIVGVSIGKVAYNMIQLRYPSAESLLEACSKHIEMIKTRFNEVTADRRACIRAAVERNECKSLERLEEDLQRLLDDHNDVRDAYEKSTYWERCSPYSQLRYDIHDLEVAAGGLLADTRNTTSARLARDQARSPGSYPPPLPCSRPTADGMEMETPRIARQSEEHSLDLPTWNVGPV